ncbi:PREDICTED: CASP-like protein 4D1 [Theobroma cacao]|uniref:CASP-like protein n=1 Tax=Theobroma cacao TaxID=3641 RepID=A0AB32VC18_THECC|nr:PREDICTED: CASP-like protein 4D1 [Theobroma cacao]
MASKAMPIATVLLRIFTILFAAGCVVVLILDKTTDVDGSKVTFKNVIAYRYVLATAVVGAAYSILQLPFAIYYACTEKRLIRGGFLPAFDFYGDKVMAFLLATGVGAGFLVTVELKEFLGDLFNEFGADLKDSPFESFFNKGYLAVSLLAGAFLCMAVLSVFSSLQRTTISGRGFFR